MLPIIPKAIMPERVTVDDVLNSTVDNPTLRPPAGLLPGDGQRDGVDSNVSGASQKP